MFDPENKFFSVLLVAVVVIVVVAGLPQGAEAWKPEMTPEDPDIYINEGEPLELRCTSSEKMQFFYPKDVGFTITTSPAELENQESGNLRTIIFRRNETIRGDTGWYGCTDEDHRSDAIDHDDPEVAWTYVWVKSNSSYFVQIDAIESVRVAAGGTVVVPCRPTSPSYEVALFSNHDIRVQMGERVSFDPKIGFQLRGVTLKDSGYYRCQIDLGDGPSQEVNYHVNVLKRQVLKVPRIMEETLRHVTRGQKLRVNCTITVESGSQYILNWTTPRRGPGIMQRQHREPFGKNYQTASCELIINEVRDEDQGEYECTVATFSDVKKAKKFVTVHDPELKYIKLTPLDENSYYRVKYGDRIQWIVHVDAYPQPVLKWLDPRGDEIVGSWAEPERSKHATNISSSMAILRINRLDLSDAGLYSLQATNADRIETLNFTLDVTAKPIPMLDKLEAFYMLGRKVDFRCEIAAFPAPEVTWSFSRAPNYPSFADSKVVKLEGATLIPKTTTFLSIVSMEMDASGHLTCTACNSLGCDSDSNVVLVSDVVDGFGIVEEETQTVGDDVVRTCAASKYNYTDVEWWNERDEPIVQTDKISITETSTDFTYRSILRIRNISAADNGTYYVCTARDDQGSIERYDYRLDIQDPVPPYFLETNMNRTEVSYDLSTEAHKSVILKCYVGGMPMPAVTWYKDDTVIRPNEQYECLHNKQELRIKYLLDENGGNYTCRVNNRFGKEENYQIILIKVRQVSKSLIISIVVLVLVCILLFIYFSIKMHREKVIRKQLMEAGLTHFEEGALECLNPDLTVDDQAELLPYDKKWEFPRERLKFGKQLGFGAFGVVMKAEARGICEHEPVSTVAVKMVRRSTESTYIRALASELKIMVHLGKHLNVVNLLGACTNNITKRELLVIVEYCRFGNLHNYLLRHRANFVDQIDPATGELDPSIGHDVLVAAASINGIGNGNSLSASSYTSNDPPGETDSQGIRTSPDACVLSNDSTQPGWRSNYHGDYKDHNLKPICSQDLLSWAFQVARGMEYLSQRKVLHGDLAARNILLAENSVVKICDFGLAKTMYKDDNYKKKGDAPLPIKWMAIESIRDRVFSTQSDIWSFGIVLWEFFTLAKTPYPGMEAEKQYQRLIEGYRMEQPEYATDRVYDIMLQCWKAKPTLRPTFTDLVSAIGDLLEKSVKEHYVDLNAPYLDMNTMTLESGKNDYLTMMTAPDHDAMTSPNREYVNLPEDSYLPMSPRSDWSESGIFSPRIVSSESDKFEFPTRSGTSDPRSDSESEAVEISPMLDHEKDADEEEDNYLKPINVRERRARFTKQRQRSTKNAAPTNADYCNAPPNLQQIKVDDEQRLGNKNDEVDTGPGEDSKNYVPTIIRTLDNYVNMPRQKDDLRKEVPASFSNPSYIAMDNAHRIEQMGV